MPATMNLIQTQRLAATQNTITFNTIPQIYTDLRVLVSARGTRTGSNRTYINVNINGSSTNNNYVRAIAYSSNATTADFDDVNSNYMVMTAADEYADTFGMSELYLFDYTNSTEYKSALVTGAALDSVATDHMIGIWGAFRTTNTAITSLSFTPDSGNFTANTVISVYGIKKA
jgi:hypothetical protein